MFSEAQTMWSICPSGFSQLSPTPGAVLQSSALWEVQGYLEFQQTGSTSSLSGAPYFPTPLPTHGLVISKNIYIVYI